MVNHPTPQPSPPTQTAHPHAAPAPPAPRPYALRSTLYTAAFLLFILGALPSVFWLAERTILDALLPPTPAADAVPPTPASPTAVHIRDFWAAFRQLLGAAVFSLGLAAYLACSAWLMYFGRGPHVEFDPPREFVASGPYRWVRNPVVITLFITVAGEAIYLASLGILVLLLIGLPLAQYQVTRIEEPRLRLRFGRSYDEYCARVRRWLPRPPAAAMSAQPPSPLSSTRASSRTPCASDHS